MKIAITNTFLPSEETSGVPYQVHHLANGLAARGHDVTVFSFSARPVDAKYAVYQFSRPRVPTPFLSFVMAYHLARADFSSFDVVHCHGDNFLLRSTCPVVRTFHGTALDEFETARTLRRRLFCLVLIPLERLGAILADHVVGISETTRARMRGVDEVIPCGVDLDAFGPGPKSASPTILFVGPEHGRKRGALLAELFVTQIQPAIPEAELHMVSDGTEIVPGIRRHGKISFEALAALYRSSWVFCMPSLYEGFGVPYVEAMASHTAVVATRPNPGATEVLGGGSYGMLVEDEQLGDTLIKALTDSALREEFVGKGTERSRTFAWATVLARYEGAYEKAISLKRNRQPSRANAIP